MTLLDEVGDLLAGEDLHLERDPEAGVLRGSYEVEERLVHVAVVVDEADDALLVYGMTELRVPEDRRAAVAEVTVRANWGLMGATVELDLDDGEVRTRASADLQVQPPTGPGLARLVQSVVVTAVSYLPAVEAVVAGASPAEAVAAAEGS